MQRSRSPGRAPRGAARLLAAALIAAALTSVPASAMTNVPGGNLTTQTWNLAGSPYILSGDVVVPSGNKLTIEAGVEVLVNSGDSQAGGLNAALTELTVRGTLEVNGALGTPVSFRAATGTSSSLWYGVVADSGSAGTIANAEIANASIGLNALLSPGNLTIDGVAFAESNNVDMQLGSHGPTFLNAVSASSVIGPLSIGAASLFHNNSPGTFVMNGALTLQSQSTYRPRLESISQFDSILAIGAVNLQGQLAVDASSLVASPGDKFQLINKTTAGAIANAFSNAPQNGLIQDSGYTFKVSYTGGTGNDLTLEVVTPQFSADFQHDGDVDAMDLQIWRGAFGVSAAGDSDSDGDSDGADFLDWQRQLGSGLSVSAAATIPEPAGLPLAVIAVLAAASGNRRRAGATAPRQSAGR